MDSRADVSAISTFDMSKLKRTATVIKQKLPTQDDIVAEKAA